MKHKFPRLTFLSSLIFIPAKVFADGYTYPQPHKRISEVKELPTTGIPLIAWSLVGLVPLGRKLTKYGRDKDNSSTDPGHIWQKRHYTVIPTE